MKYVDSEVTFAEFPDEISLCINISGCPNHCVGCHSDYLAKDIGKELNINSLKELIDKNKGISCIGLMGGDQNPKEINNLARFVFYNYPNLKIGWYSGKQEISKDIDLCNFNYIKLGPYIKEFGPLNKITTNQKMYKIVDNQLINITKKFWKNDSNS